MSTKRGSLLVSCLLASAVIGVCCVAQGSEKPTKIFHRDGELNSQILGLDAKGNAFGIREVRDENGHHEEAFWIGGGSEKSIPALEGYTHSYPLAISSGSGLCAGRAMRFSETEGNLQAFLYDPSSGKVSGLGFLPGDRASSATGISADGRTVCGYSVGEKGIRPCVWTRDGETWKVTELSALVNDNPLLAGKGLVISPDGSKIAGCVTVKVVVAGRIYISHLFQWDKGADGTWSRKLLSEIGVATAMNDRGGVVGSYGTEEGEEAFLITPDKGFQKLGFLPEDKTSLATAINNEGLVAGSSGASGYERAFVWRNGKMESLTLLEDTILSRAHAINDRGEVAGYLGGEEDSHIYPFVHKLGR